jgi:hypothetical protein
MIGRNALVLIFAALVTREAWLCLRLLGPYLQGEINPFPYYPISIAIETYAYFACYYLSMMIFAWAFVTILPQYHTILTVWFFLQGIELIDYFLTYNTPWFTVVGVGVSITLVKFIILSILMIIEWTRQ